MDAMSVTVTKKRYNVLASLCIIVGFLLILENYGYVSGMYKLWPVFPLVIGIGLYLVYRDRGRTDPVILAIGVYIIQFSILAFYATYTSWSSMEYLWPLYIGFLGVSILSIYISNNKSIIFFHLSFFLIGLCVVFFLVFSISARLWPISLILLGISILLIKEFNKL